MSFINLSEIKLFESNGLFSVHEFLMRFIRNAQRDIITQWDRDNYTFQCKKLFRIPQKTANNADFINNSCTKLINS